MADIHIPDDILRNILARLRAKPLLRSRCVSKRWNCLISDPYFMKSRLCRKMLLVAPPLYVLDGSAPVDDLAIHMGKLRYLFEMKSFVDVKILGKFNGIVLLVVCGPNRVVGMSGYHNYHIILYNPFTGASKILHDPYSPSNNNFHLYGFCYGATLDDLKIVRFRGYTSCPNYNWKTCDVFKLKTSSWSTSEIPIQDANFTTRDRGNVIGTFINGFLYWIASKKIVALSVKMMVISEISLPVPDNMEIIFGTLHGCLCSITRKNNFYDHEFNVWVMKEHGVENPWSIVHSFKLPYKIRCLPGFQIINTMDDARVLMVDCSNHLLIFDMLKHSYKKLNISQSFIDFRCASGIEYDESLISPSDICGVK